ncbi:hypothetical protein ACEPAI_7942 [Sanghuangporus weigelae]
MRLLELVKQTGTVRHYIWSSFDYASKPMIGPITRHVDDMYFRFRLSLRRPARRVARHRVLRALLIRPSHGGLQ